MTTPTPPAAPATPPPATLAPAPLTLTPEQAGRLLTALGLPTDTTDPELILATVEDLAKADAGDPVAAARRVGMEALDVTTLEALRADAQCGRELVAAAARREVEDNVDKAIKAGKIPPARRDHWVQLVGNDRKMADVLASMPDNLVPVDEIGHGVVGDQNGDLAEPAAWFR